MNRPKFSVWINTILIFAGLYSSTAGDVVKSLDLRSQEVAAPLEEMSAEEIREARQSFESTAREVKRKLDIYDRDRTQPTDVLGKISFSEIIATLEEAMAIPPGITHFSEEYISRRKQIVTLFLDSVTAQKSFPEETRLWAYELTIMPPSVHPESIFLWWEHNEKAVTSGEYSEAKWLYSSRAAKSDEHFAANLEREVQVAAEMAKRDGLPYAHLEAELAKLQKTHDARVKRRSELRLQWEKEMEGIEIARRAQPIKEQKEREKRRQQSTLSSPERKATRSQEDEKASNPASHIIRWSPLAVIPILGGIYLVLRKRFLFSR